MTDRPVWLIDPRTSSKVGALDVRPRGDQFEGTISLNEASPEVRQLFERFEQVVEGQMFTFLDDIEGKIGSIPFQVVFVSGSKAAVADLQVFPSTRAVSFRTSKG